MGPRPRRRGRAGRGPGRRRWPQAARASRRGRAGGAWPPRGQGGEGEEEARGPVGEAELLLEEEVQEGDDEPRPEADDHLGQKEAEPSPKPAAEAEGLPSPPPGKPPDQGVGEGEEGEGEKEDPPRPKEVREVARKQGGEEAACRGEGGLEAEEGHPPFLGDEAGEEGSRRPLDQGPRQAVEGEAGEDEKPKAQKDPSAHAEEEGELQAPHIPHPGDEPGEGQAKATPERRTTAWARPMAWREKPKASGGS